MTTPEQLAAWRAEFEAWKTDSGWNSFAYEPMSEAYIAACRARHAGAVALRAENKRLRGALEKAICDLIMAEQDVADWGVYASAYFQEKHGLDDDVKYYHDAAIAARDALVNKTGEST